MKKTICLDFDGVINSYKSGWKSARNIPDEPVEGAIEWIENFILMECVSPKGGYNLAIYSSRSKHFGGIRAMRKYLLKHGLERRFLKVIKFPKQKPAHFLMIDDRAFRFEGKFPTHQEIHNFKSWIKREKKIEGGLKVE